MPATSAAPIGGVGFEDFLLITEDGADHPYEL
jgi:hypothetical protein